MSRTRIIDILFTARDGISQAFNNMRDAANRFGRSTQDIDNQIAALSRRQTALASEMARVRTQMDAARNAVSAARRDYRQLNDETNRTNLQNAHQAYDRLNNQLRQFQREGRLAEQEMANLRSAQSRLNNMAGVGMLGQLAKAGFARMAGDTLAQGVRIYASSAYGSEAGMVIGGTLSGASSGAAMGTMIGGPVGTAVGTAVGAALGTAQGKMQVGQQQDEAFRGVIQDQYNNITQQRDQDLAAGKEIYAQREMAQISFATLFKDEDVAKDYLAWVKDTANATPFLYDDLITLSKTLAAYDYTPDEMKEALIQIGDAGAAMGLGIEDMKMVATGLGRMRSTGVTQRLYTDLLQERGIDAIGYLAEAYGKTKAEIYEGITNGLIPGADAAKIIAEAMGEANKNAMALQSQTFSGLTSTAEGFKQEMQAAMGEGYDEYMKPYLERSNDAMSGEFGEQLAEGHKMVGAFYAQVEAERMEALSEAQKEVLNSEEFLTAKAEGNFAEAGALIVKAEAEGMKRFMESDGYQLYLETEKQKVEILRNTLAPVWRDFGYEMQTEFSKGIGALTLSEPLNIMIVPAEPAYTAAYGTVGQEQESRPGKSRPTARPVKRAMGMPYVPYDNFPALLHEGERVLTAAEARAAQGGKAPVTVTGNTFVIREEADVDRIAAALARKIQWAGEAS